MPAGGAPFPDGLILGDPDDARCAPAGRANSGDEA